MVCCSRWYGRRGLYIDEFPGRRVFQFGKLLSPDQILQPPHILGNLGDESLNLEGY